MELMADALLRGDFPLWQIGVERLLGNSGPGRTDYIAEREGVTVAAYSEALLRQRMAEVEEHRSWPRRLDGGSRHTRTRPATAWRSPQ